MRLIIGIILTTLFYLATAKKIKKYPVAFYLGTYMWIGITVGYYLLKINNSMPSWFTTYFMDLFQRGIFSTVTFMIVMFLGTVTKSNEISKKLMSIRGEISIMGCIFVLCHNVIYGVVYFPALFKNPQLMPTNHLIAAVITLILLALMLPLFITSFKCVRKKMNAKSWKNLQRLAYPFFILIYVHIMTLYLPSWKQYTLDIALYTIIYASYIVLRLRKRSVTIKRRTAALASK